MKGAHRIVVQNKRIRYDFEIRRNITIIRGDSATGKTALVDMIREYFENGFGSGVELICDKQCAVVEGRTWAGQLSEITDSIVFIDEGNEFVIADHFIMLFRDMAYETLNEFHNRNRFFHILFIFMAVVMESDKVAVIFINPGGGNNGTSKVASNVFYDCFRIAFVRLGIHIEPFFVFPVAAGYDFFKGGADFRFHFIKQGSAEGVTKECIVEVIDVAPKSMITVTSLRNETMDMRVPF